MLRNPVLASALNAARHLAWPISPSPGGAQIGSLDANPGRGHQNSPGRISLARPVPGSWKMEPMGGDPSRFRPFTAGFLVGIMTAIFSWRLSVSRVSAGPREGRRDRTEPVTAGGRGSQDAGRKFFNCDAFGGAH
jgi:hypothetical protein